MGGKRTKRTPLARGIYQDKYGIGIPIRGKEHRFPLGTPLEQLLRKKRDLEDAAGTAPGRAGTIASDAAAYLATIPEGKPRTAARNELQPWVDVFGDRASADVSVIQIRQQRAAWQTKGPNGKPISKKHLNNMLHRLRAMFTANHGRALNPALDVKVFPIRYEDARAMPTTIIDAIIGSMADTAWPVNPKKKAPPANKAKLRLRVMEYTGLSQAMLKLVRPEHLNFRKKTMYVTIRTKTGVEAATLTMTNKAVAAWRALVQAGGLGYFSTRSLAAAWRRAVIRTRAAWDAKQATKRRPRPWPLHDDDRAYDLRHSFGTWALVETGDLEGTAELMRHKNLNTTRRYTKGAAKVRAARAVKALNRSKGLQ